MIKDLIEVCNKDMTKTDRCIDVMREVYRKYKKNKEIRTLAMDNIILLLEQRVEEKCNRNYWQSIGNKARLSLKKQVREQAQNSPQD